MLVGVEVTRIADLEGQWEDAVADASDEGTPDVETVAIARSLSILSEIAQIPAASITDVAVKIGIAARDLRLHTDERLLVLVLESAEQDCLRIAREGVPASAPGCVGGVCVI
jgi:hypothetical protein